MPDAAASVVGDEEAAVFADGDAYRAAPDLAVRGDEAGEEVVVLPLAWPSCMGMRITS